MLLCSKQFVSSFRSNGQKLEIETHLINLENIRRKSSSSRTKLHHNERHEFEKPWNGEVMVTLQTGDETQ